MKSVSALIEFIGSDVVHLDSCKNRMRRTICLNHSYMAFLNTVINFFLCVSSVSGLLGTFERSLKCTKYTNKHMQM